MGLFEVEYLNSKGLKRRTTVFALDEETALGIVRQCKGNANNLNPANGRLLCYLAVVLLVTALIVCICSQTKG